MGTVVSLDDYRPKPEIADEDQRIIDTLLGVDNMTKMNDATGFMMMRVYQMGVKTTDVNVLMDMDVIRFLALGMFERNAGLETDNTLLLDTLRLHFQIEAPVGLIGVKEEG